MNITGTATGEQGDKRMSDIRQENGYGVAIGGACLELDESSVEYMTGQKGKPNSEISIGGVIHKTDGKGKVIFNPNTTYRYGDAQYQTDAQGRVAFVAAKVKVTHSPRGDISNKRVEDRILPQEDYANRDDRGHIIAHMLGGSDDEINLVAQNWHLNQQEYKSLEYTAANAYNEQLENSPDERENVYMVVELLYDDGNDIKKPNSIIASVEVGQNVIACMKFQNCTNTQSKDLLNG